MKVDHPIKPAFKIRYNPKIERFLLYLKELIVIKNKQNNSHITIVKNDKNI